MGHLKVAVITGGHTFDVIGLHDMFNSFEGCDCYVQPLEDWSAGVARKGSDYDVLVFYNMHTMAPQNAPGGARTRRAIDTLGEGPGIVVLHHGILAFKADPVWDALVGMQDRTIDDYSHDELLTVHIADTDHEITRGLGDFTITDETYDFRDVEGPDSHVLLSVQHPGSMSTQAWTRTYRDVRVLNLVLGHDAQAYANDMYRTVLRRGILWCGTADALPD
jgi:uncharacterized protein